MGDVIFFDPRGNFSQPSQELINRHLEYLAQANRLSNGELSRMVIFTRKNPGANIKVYNGVILTVNCGLLQWIRVMINTLNPIAATAVKVDAKIVSCSDAWSSGILGVLFSWRTNGKVPIQIQVHADFLSQNWAYRNLLNFIKSHIAIWTLKRADQIRCVSTTLRDELATRYNLPYSKLVVLPVPIDLPRILPTSNQRPLLTIGLVGRLHDERGIDTFCELATNLISELPEVKAVVIGDGPEREHLERCLSKALLKGQYEFLGHLVQEELESAWQKIGVLVSTAPSESYGRTMREALLRGIPVWAIQSRGVDELILEFGQPGVFLLKIPTKNSELKAKFLEISNTKIDRSYLSQYKSERAKLIESIGQSWAQLLQK